MDKLNYFKQAIDRLREMERNARDIPAEALRYFDRFIRDEIFGNDRLDFTAEERDALQDYYIATL
ncbi:MAG: hypothetical protein IJP68_08535 [Selenomonadaceae bacterium]|nr:hypothetical protein [Selenomonadaceae bacterium]